MRLTFIGAAHEVTGSCYVLESDGKTVLVDCGMEQGADMYENQTLPVSAAKIDYVLLTHAHIDHSGLLPMLYKDGFRGRIFSTKATKELADIMLRDSAHIQEFEAEWRNRKAKRSGTPPYTPIYTGKDAIATLRLMSDYDYEERVSLCDNISIVFHEAGHLLGSSSIEVEVSERGITKRLVFSGDLGNSFKPMLNDPAVLTTADYVVVECTYGDRLHSEKAPDYVGSLTKIIQRTLDRGGNVVIPTFAVGRMQELLYFLRIIKEQGLVKGHDGFPVYVDSPLAVEATKVFNRNMDSYMDEETARMVHEGIDPLDFDGLRLSSTSDDSKAINEDSIPKVILSASGMCEAGRIRHHLKHNLWNFKSTILFVGYQVEGTIGRNILDGATAVKLFGETVSVNADICQLEGTSSHADKKGLLQWLQSFSPKPQRVFVTHGDDSVCDYFCDLLKDEERYASVAPYSGMVWDLIEDRCLYGGNKTKIKKDKEGAQVVKAGSAYANLIQVGKQVTQAIHSNYGGTNFDLNNFAKELEALIDKYKRKE